MAEIISYPSVGKGLNAYRISSSILDVRYTSPLNKAGSYAASGTITGSLLHAIPYPVEVTETLISISINNGTNAPSVNAELGIYMGNPVYPGALVLDAGSVVLDGVSGIKTIVINQTLTPKLYWLAYVADATAALNSLLVPGDVIPIGGGGFTAANYNNKFYAFRVAQAFGALPDPFPNGATALITSACPLIAVEIQ